MPASLLWAVDSGGRVSTLSTGGVRWQELPYSGIDLKRVSALRSCAWGVASDHQVYVFVPQGDVPIRVPEVTYENQRWNPREGFCSRLLPTDRPSWSSQDGLVARSKESIRLPSSGWQWEGCWYIEDNLDGQPLGSEGWSYCVDFPFTYTLEKKWNSMVRRRKWIWHRRYVATDRWAKIEGVHSDPIAEPFVDIAVGGNEVPGGDPDHVIVWAVTVQGRVMFRNHVTRLCPEGTSWSHVPVPESSEVTQVSVGPTGLTWAVAWNGTALVRLGVSRENYAGLDWAEVAAPENDDKLLQVAVGHNTLWAVGRSGTVWFRKGIHGDDLGCRASITGSGWVKMVGEMAMISVGPNDQVWGITRDDRRLTLRTGVTLHEACGREWKEIVAPFGNAPSRSSSLTSLASLGSLRLTSSPAAVTQPTMVTATLVEANDAKGFTF
uniref:Peroxin/Ferlin domain-containing protein n=2 Tax=Ixodes scapularis TaxID=6945 RepID=A0A1S4LB63_IXOSC